MGFIPITPGLGSIEKGRWRVIKETTEGVIPDFNDTGWQPFKIQSGAAITDTPTLIEIDPIRDTLSAYDTEIGKEVVAGELPLYFEAPTTIGGPNDCDTMLELLFGSKHTTAAMTNAAIKDVNTIQVDAIDPNLKVNDIILLKITLDSVNYDYPVAVTSLNTTATPDEIGIFPPLPATATLNSTSIGAARHYTPKTGLPTGCIQRLEADDQILFSYPACRISQGVFEMTPNNPLVPKFTVSGTYENEQDSFVDTYSPPSLGKSFVMKGARVLIDDEYKTWNASVTVTYSNQLGEKEGIEAATGVSGHYENVRQITVALNFQYNNAAERAKFRTAQSRKMLIYGSRTMDDGSIRCFAWYFPNLKATALTEPITGRQKKYQMTARAYQKDTNGDNEVCLSLF